MSSYDYPRETIAVYQSKNEIQSTDRDRIKYVGIRSRWRFGWSATRLAVSLDSLWLDGDGNKPRQGDQRLQRTSPEGEKKEKKGRNRPRRRRAAFFRKKTDVQAKRRQRSHMTEETADEERRNDDAAVNGTKTRLKTNPLTSGLVEGESKKRKGICRGPDDGTKMPSEALTQEASKLNDG